MEFEQLANLIQEKCPQILRNSWKPVIAKKPSENKYVTKFGGADPFRGNNFQWPRCLDKECGKEKVFICQINLDDLPDKLKSHIGKDSGLFQCFWCTGRFSDCDKWAAPDGEEPSLNSNIKFIPTTEKTSKMEMIPSLEALPACTRPRRDGSQCWGCRKNNSNTKNLPDTTKTTVQKLNKRIKKTEEAEDAKIKVAEEVQIESWVESAAKELPESMEITDNEKISEVVMSLPGITEDVLMEVEFEEGEDAEPIGTPLRGVKLGGYVAWFEGETAYSKCSDCDVVMDVTFLQLEYDRSALRFDWDSGAACITLCPSCGKPEMYWRNNP